MACGLSLVLHAQVQDQRLTYMTSTRNSVCSNRSQQYTMTPTGKFTEEAMSAVRTPEQNYERYKHLLLLVLHPSVAEMVRARVRVEYAKGAHKYEVTGRLVKPINAL